MLCDLKKPLLFTEIKYFYMLGGAFAKNQY